MITPESIEFETFVNGEVIDEPKQIFHGDRVVVGGSHYFRISNPTCPNRSKTPVVDYHLAHQEILKEQEKRLRNELNAEKEAAILQIEEERNKNEGLFKERIFKLEMETSKYNFMKELMDSEKEAMNRPPTLDDDFQYRPPQSNLSEQIEQWHPEQSLHETQIRVKEATQRCRALGLNYEFVQTQVADKFGFFDAVVNIIDRDGHRMAEWPTARLDIWLDWIRDHDAVTVNNIFECVDVHWTDREDDGDQLNESLNSSRISLNLNAIRGSFLSNSMRNSLSNIRDKFMPWGDRNNRATSTTISVNATESILRKSSGPKEFLSPKKMPRNGGNKENVDNRTQANSFEIETQIELRNLRKAALRLKQLCAANEQRPPNASTTSDDIKLARTAVAKIENLTNELRTIFKIDGDDAVSKTPKSVRFVLD